MAWTIDLSPHAERQLAKLDKTIAKRIRHYLTIRVAENPWNTGGPLTGPLDRYWRYRVGDYRILCEFFQDRLIVHVVKVEHRSQVYR